ncbi:hypothetical protein NQ315_014540 [Exocentrus adspersus]|uniref:Uncharacterized protein n=1 Tax=Exocentrus adspersus TaxID=1586481 RepID=A0AAV8VLH5_9CUCU|nr:hypothetical protein NQ315_014540 [Exocentrus adspersus]
MTHSFWPHGRDTVEELLQHLYEVLTDIKFTMELEKDGTLPFLSLLEDRTTHWDTESKPTHTGGLKEHKSDLKNNNFDKSTVTEYTADTGHTIQTGEKIMDQTYRELI